MHKLKSLLYVLVGFVVLITVFSLLMPSQVIVARSVQVNASKEQILQQVSNLQQWHNWQPIFMQSPKNVLNPGKVGSHTEWEANGKINTIVITALDNSFVKFLVQRQGEKDIENMISIKPLSGSPQLNVEWMSVNKLKWYPWEKFAGIFLDKMVAPSYTEALENLKKYCETRP